jgi:hypothetical protein
MAREICGLRGNGQFELDFFIPYFDVSGLCDPFASLPL